jgi:hypothetical protein
MLLRLLVGSLIAGPLFCAELTIVNPQLHDFEDGPPVASTDSFGAGKTVFLSFQIGGFQATEDDHIQLAYEISTIDPAQKPLGPVKTGKVEAELAPEDKKKGAQWMPKIRYQIQIPATPAPGAYQIQIHVNDQISGARLVKDVPFLVRSTGIESSDTLTIRNFRFLRSEGEKDRLPEGDAYRPGDAVWAHFDITGYKFGPNNRYDVKYGVSLRDAAGKTLFSNPNAAQDTNESFYPRTYIPGEFSLNLDKNIRPGDYTLVLALFDAIGQQSFESNHLFRVE